MKIKRFDPLPKTAPEFPRDAVSVPPTTAHVRDSAGRAAVYDNGAMTRRRHRWTPKTAQSGVPSAVRVSSVAREPGGPRTVRLRRSGRFRRQRLESIYRTRCDLVAVCVGLTVPQKPRPRARTLRSTSRSVAGSKARTGTIGFGSRWSRRPLFSIIWPAGPRTASLRRWGRFRRHRLGSRDRRRRDLVAVCDGLASSAP